MRDRFLQASYAMCTLTPRARSLSLEVVSRYRDPQLQVTDITWICKLSYKVYYQFHIII